MDEKGHITADETEEIDESKPEIFPSQLSEIVPTPTTMKELPTCGKESLLFDPRYTVEDKIHGVIM